MNSPTLGLSFFERWREQSAASGDVSGRAESLANLSEAYQLANREEDPIRAANQGRSHAASIRQRHSDWL